MQVRRFKKLISYTLVLSLVASLLLPSLSVALQSESRILLCTSQGYQWITISEQSSLELSNSGFNKGGGVLEHCAFCTNPLDEEPELFLFAHSVLFLKQLKNRPLVSDVSSEKFQFLAFKRQPRAPPYSI